MQLNANKLLKIYFDRKKLSHPGYSLRALARDLNISPTYLSYIFNEKKAVPVKRLTDFIRLLDLDDVAILQIKRALDGKKSLNPELSNSDKDFINKYLPLDKRKLIVLEYWYNLALLDLTTCNNFKYDIGWISKKLGISRIKVMLSIEHLLKLGMLEELDGKLIKTCKKIRFPSSKSKLLIRNFHRQMIKLSLNQLTESSSENINFNRRLITGSTFATNHKKVEEAKRKINDILYQISEEASQGNCDSVYQFNIQFFPLTN